MKKRAVCAEENVFLKQLVLNNLTEQFLVNLHHWKMYIMLFICTTVHPKYFNHFRGSLNHDQCAVSTFLDFCTGTLALVTDALRGHLHNLIYVH